MLRMLCWGSYGAANSQMYFSSPHLSWNTRATHPTAGSLHPFRTLIVTPNSVHLNWALHFLLQTWSSSRVPCLRERHRHQLRCIGPKFPLTSHIQPTAKSCWLDLLPLFSISTTVSLVQTIIISHINYCDSLLIGLSTTPLSPFQSFLCKVIR